MSASTHGKHGKRRPGVHKNRFSPETILWDREHRIPEQPPWMDAGTYVRLVRLRNSIETTPERTAAA